MAGLAESGSNPDVDLLYDINGLAKDAPHWFDKVMEYVGEYGLLLAMVLLVLWCWWGVRKRGGDNAASSVAALVWAPLAAAVAVLINVPIRGFVERPRPFVDHQGLDVLVDGKTDFSFVSDHATLTMAMGVGLFVANRKFGLVGIGLALLEGFCRVYMGVHYPTDVIGGFALGTAVALLLSPVAMMLLTPLMRAVEGSRRLGWVVRAKGTGEDGRSTASGARSERSLGTEERDLAA
ncbi:phosphatase PAP2 family protein [Streptomyces sp. XM83C]|jgi:undecaprenyl-diphosphatase|uniref:Phosphatase PAP2 family protein n=1 Tax=Streptomyces thermocoprophilus TaxID=78356 RepID=A0ABV5VL31_9ACTN|nr:phosphatase PAP2 family protein [Streptomyces sp. XM83C]MCK1821250.1 phosphatase PAP2 family protein [Streptomyces sp. XM83C]